MAKAAARKTPKKPTRRTSQRKPKGRKKESVTVEYVKAILFAVGLALLIRTFVIQAFRIPSGSMEDTLLVGDFFLANKFIYGAQIPFTNARLPALRDPRPGDVIIFQFPRDPDRDFIKRLVAVPGQTVEIRNKVLYVDGKRTVDPPHSKYVDPVIKSKNSPAGIRDNLAPTVVPSDHYFVMGDNRDNSEDSRYWGMLSRELIRGEAIILYWSWSPDPQAPVYSNLFSIPGMIFYNLFHFPSKVRWGRIGMLVR